MVYSWAFEPYPAMHAPALAQDGQWQWWPPSLLSEIGATGLQMRMLQFMCAYVHHLNPKNLNQYWVLGNHEKILEICSGHCPTTRPIVRREPERGGVGWIRCRTGRSSDRAAHARQRMQQRSGETRQLGLRYHAPPLQIDVATFHAMSPIDGICVPDRVEVDSQTRYLSVYASFMHLLLVFVGGQLLWLASRAAIACMWRHSAHTGGAHSALCVSSVRRRPQFHHTNVHCQNSNAYQKNLVCMCSG